MTYSHEEANARLLDLVYGEAAPGERAALEAHVAGCARCQKELAALGGTRAVVRAALVDEPAPPGVHARLMRAATQAVAPARAAAPAVPRVAPPKEAPSFWQKVRRGWTLPTFATVGAFAILLLASKVFLSPERTYERGHRGVIPAEPAPAASARDVENAPATTPPSEDKAAAPEGRADEAARAEVRRQAGLARQSAVAASLGKSMRHEHGADGLSGALGRETAKEAFGGPEWRRTGASGKVSGLGALRGVSGSVGGGGAASPKPVSRSVGGAPSDDFAAPPAGWKKGGAAAPASPAPPPAPAPIVKRNVVEEPVELDRAAPAAKADRRAVEEMDEMEAAPSRRKADKATVSESFVEKKKAEPPPAAGKPAPVPPAAAALSAPAEQPLAKDAPTKTASDAKERDAAPTQEALARRAEQLFAARRWDEAVAAYRELLRRFPAADPAAKWRTRLAQAERESADVTASRAAAKAAPKAESTKKPAKAAPASEGM